MQTQSELVRMCIQAATESSTAVEKWRRQRRTLERMPVHLSEPLLRQLLDRRLLFPSLLEVFKYSVEEIDLRGLSFVDTEWMAYLGGFQYLRTIVLSDCHRLNNSALWNLTGMSNLKELDVSRCSKITDAGIRHILSVPSLEKLCISQTGVMASGVAALASLTNLRMLDLGRLPVTDSTLSSLQSLTKLEHLELWGSELSNNGAALLKTFPSLTFLNLAWTSITKLPSLSPLKYLNMSNCTIQYLFEQKGQKTHLEKLILSGTTIDDFVTAFQYVEISKLSFLDLSYSSLQSFTLLQSMNILTHLNLSNTSMNDSSIEYIAYIGETLLYLNLSNTKITSDSISILAGRVPNLETLLLSHTAIDDSAVSYISMMSSLKAIDLSSTKIKGLIYQSVDDHDLDSIPSFSTLQNLYHLETLDLEGIDVTGVTIYSLIKCIRLRHLSLRNFSLTDETLHHISSIPNMTHIIFRDGILTNGGLLSFNPPPKLKKLDINGCWLLTENAISTFHQKYPQIEVRHELVEFNDSSPLQVYTTPSPWKSKQSKMSMSPPRCSELNLDQRLKYTREELLSLQPEWPTFAPLGKASPL